MNNSSKNKLFCFLCQYKSSRANSSQIRQKSHSFTITSIILQGEACHVPTEVIASISYAIRLQIWNVASATPNYTA